MKNQIPAKLGIFGASGFSREVADICLELKCNEIVFIEMEPIAEICFGFPIVTERTIPMMMKDGFQFVIGTGNNRVRKKIYEKFKGLSFPNIIHPSATMGHKQLDQVRETMGNIVTAGVRFTNNIVMGNFGIFNLNATIGHDCIIEDFVNIAPGANVSGNVIIKKGAYIGTNAAILQGKSINSKITIGEYATVGAGAMVIKDVQDHTTVVGIPAEPTANNNSESFD